MTCLKKNILKDKTDIKFIDMSHSDYQGMNYYANKELKTEYRMKKKDIYIESDMSDKDKKSTIRHELVERSLMSKGLKYRKADSIASKYG